MHFLLASWFGDTLTKYMFMMIFQIFLSPASCLFVLNLSCSITCTKLKDNISSLHPSGVDFMIFTSLDVM